MQADITTSKRSLRKSIQAQRDELEPDQHKRFSMEAADRLFSLKIYKNAKNILAYYPFRSEIDTRLMIIHAIIDDKNVALPRVNKYDKLDLFYIKDIEEDLQKGSFGIMEPRPADNEKAYLKDIDLVIVPGVAFDKKLNRLGYGGGFYDRLLEELDDDVPLVSVCFELQIVDKIPVAEHDRKVDLIITEKKTYGEK